MLELKNVTINIKKTEEILWITFPFLSGKMIKP